MAFALVVPLPSPQLQLLLLWPRFRRLVRLLGKDGSGETGDDYQSDECFHGMVPSLQNLLTRASERKPNLPVIGEESAFRSILTFYSTISAQRSPSCRPPSGPHLRTSNARSRN